jgi:hypothetical protein
MRSPKTRSGRVWVDQHFAHLRTFLESGRSNGEALREAARALNHLLERDPDYAPETRQLATQFVMANWNAGWADIIVDVVRTGCDADLCAPELRTVPVPTALLHIFCAEARRIDGDRLRGMDSLDRALRRLEDAPADDRLARLVRGRAHLLRGELQEIGQEMVQARKAFQEAREAIRPILSSRGALEAIAVQWSRQVFGPEDSSFAGQTQGLGAMALHQFADSHVRALMGALRTGTGTPEQAELDELRAAVEVNGLGTAVNPLLMLPALSRLAPDDASALGAFLAESSAAATGRLAGKGMVQRLDPELLAMVNRAVASGAGNDLMRRLWTVVTELAVARGLESRGELAASNKALHALTNRALREAGSAVGKALVLGHYVRFLCTYSSDPKQNDGLVGLFCTLLEAAWRTDGEAFLDLRFRTQFDEIVAAVATYFLLAPEGAPESDSRRIVSVLLDLLRVREMPPVLSLSDELSFDTPSQEVSKGFKSIADTLERIVTALGRASDTVAVISHDASPAGELMILASQAGLSVHKVGKTFSEAAALLEDAAELAADLAPLQAAAGLASGDADPLALAARHAWMSLAVGVREAIAGAKVVLLVPDYRSKVPLLPWELLHDGEDYLLNRKVLARFGSLKHLACTLDVPVSHGATRHALVVSASDAIPQRPLRTAAPECTQVRIGLRAAGFDAPDITESRLDAGFFTDRLGWIDVLHVAAHGESLAGTEYLVLPNGRRLSVDQLLARRQRSMPFVFLNTCQLGLTRYLGGGQSRGLAFTLTELGAPAVMANTANVLDDVATELATAFYEEALSQPVGAALLAARRRLQASTHPVLVARIVLYGDPLSSFAEHAGSRTEGDGASQFLDAYFDGRTECARAQTLQDPELLGQLLSGGMRAQAARQLIAGFARLHPGELDLEAQLAELTHAIALADELRHPAAMAMMRYVRASLAIQRGDGERERSWMRDAIVHLGMLPASNSTWANALATLRAELRKRILRERGLEVRHHGLADETGVLDAVMAIKLATEQAQEDEMSPVVPRESEEGLNDILWNAVTAGHPNRFEDTIEASAYAGVVARKLVARGFVAQQAVPVAHPMLTGLLWWLWSSQNTSYLDPAMAEGQTGTLLVMLADLADSNPLEGSEPWRQGLRSFPGDVDTVLSTLKKVPWERAYLEIPKRMTALQAQAEALLARIAEASPGALAGAAAYLTGVVAVKNVFTPLECQDDMHKHMTAVVNALNGSNEGRFMPYLMKGFEATRTRGPDELARWRRAQLSRTL